MGWKDHEVNSIAQLRRQLCQKIRSALLGAQVTAKERRELLAAVCQMHAEYILGSESSVPSVCIGVVEAQHFDSRVANQNGDLELSRHKLQRIERYV